MGRITRRVLIGAGVAGAGALGLSALGCGGGDALAWAPERLRVVRARVPDADAVGADLRQSMTASALAAACGTVPGLVAAMAEGCPIRRAQMLDAAIRRDYAEGHVVVVRRWVLSRSEALVAAVT